MDMDPLTDYYIRQGGGENDFSDPCLSVTPKCRGDSASEASSPAYFAKCSSGYPRWSDPRSRSAQHRNPDPHRYRDQATFRNFKDILGDRLAESAQRILAQLKGGGRKIETSNPSQDESVGTKSQTGDQDSE